MTPQDYLYSDTFKKFHAQGFPERESEKVAARALEFWRKSKKATSAQEEAIKEGKRLYRDYKDKKAGAR